MFCVDVCLVMYIVRVCVVLCHTLEVGVCIVLYCTLGVGVCMYCVVLYIGCRCMSLMDEYDVEFSILSFFWVIKFDEHVDSVR